MREREKAKWKGIRKFEIDKLQNDKTDKTSSDFAPLRSYPSSFYLTYQHARQNEFHVCFFLIDFEAKGIWIVWGRGRVLFYFPRPVCRTIRRSWPRIEASDSTQFPRLQASTTLTEGCRCRRRQHALGCIGTLPLSYKDRCARSSHYSSSTWAGVSKLPG